MTPEPWITAVATAASSMWPFAASLAIVITGGRMRESRTRRRLNERLHELRRPLHAIALTCEARPSARPESIELAMAALADLDREVNGGPAAVARRPVEARMLAIAACERWRSRAGRAGRRISVRWRCGDTLADVDPVRVSQALDNLIANAIEHGGGPITIEGATHDDRLDLIVRDSGGWPDRRSAVRSDPRRGHGLRLTRRLARANGGELRLRERGGGTAAALELPVARRAHSMPAPHRR